MYCYFPKLEIENLMSLMLKYLLYLNIWDQTPGQKFEVFSLMCHTLHVLMLHSEVFETSSSTLPTVFFSSM